MKIHLNKKSPGVVLIVALFVIVGAGVVLGSYLTLMQNESRSVARSQIWNSCVPVMEAGVELGMAQIQYCGLSTNLSSNNWTLKADGYYYKTNTVGANGSYCIIQILPVIPPVIYSTAYVPIPDTATNYLTRKVKITTTNGFGSGGLVAKGAIALTGNARLDSYNSMIAPYNSASPGTNAIAKTDSTNAGTINLTGSSLIYGMAVTGPGGSITVSGTSGVGTGGSGLMAGWTANDANFQITDPTLPDTSGWSASLITGNIGKGSNYTYMLANGNFTTNTLSLSGVQNMGIQGNVKLYVAGNLKIANGTYIYIAPNSSLTLYVGGTIDIAGAGVVNGTSSTSALTVYGLTGCTNVAVANGTAFIGTIDAPEAAINVTGAGGVYGQITGNTITIANSGALHYDQALGGSQYYNAFSWNEL